MLSDLVQTIEDDVVYNDDLADSNPALYRLFESYIEIQPSLENAPEINEGGTGADLKAALKLIPVKDRLDLLTEYSNQLNGKGNSEKTKDNDNSNDSVANKIWNDVTLRRWLVKSLTRTAIGLMLLVTGAVIALGLMTGSIGDGVFVNTILNTAIEVMKLIFGTN